ncbi:MAG: hypothetical protein ACHQ1H_05315 [Nitrososphaerales archaeon]
MRKIIRRFRGVVRAFVILGSSPYLRAQNQSATISGNFQLAFDNQAGMSTYTISYSYPSTVVWGNNVTIVATVQINNLTGLELYLKDYGLTATILSSNGFSAINQVLGGAPAVSGPPSQQPPGVNLYQGSRWGPLSIEIPITRAQFGNPGVASLNASISLQFVGDVQNDRSANSGPGVTHYDIGSRVIGSLEIRSGNQELLPYYVSAGIVGAAVVALVILRRFHRI